MLKGKKIVIIGGTSGIGLSAAMAFEKEGADVLVVGLDEKSCLEAKQVLSGRSLVIMGDARKEELAESVIKNAKAKMGGMDGLFHVAGGSGRKWGDGPLHECSLEGWQKTFDLNLTTLMLSNRAAIRHFLAEKKPGSILNLGSVLGYSPSPDFFHTHAYAAAKSAIIGFSKSLAAYYATHNIRINVLAPALTFTPMAQRAAENKEIMEYVKKKQPLDGGRIALPGDLDGAAIYFMSDKSGFTTGQVMSVDGGWTVSGR